MQELNDDTYAKALGGYIRNKDFQGAFVMSGYKELWLLDYCVNDAQLDDSAKYEHILDFYSNTEARSGQLRKYIKIASSIKPLDLLDKYNFRCDGGGYISVYCASCNVKKQISWTLDKEVAVKFQKRHELLGDISHVYMGRIALQDIVGYLNNREEQEIIQLNSVIDIQIISI